MNANTHVLQSVEGTVCKNLPASAVESVKQDAKDEENAIKLYKTIIQKAESEGDTTTAHLFRDILEDEEEHHDFFTSALEES